MIIDSSDSGANFYAKGRIAGLHIAPEHPVIHELHFAILAAGSTQIQHVQVIQCAFNSS